MNVGDALAGKDGSGDGMSADDHCIGCRNPVRHSLSIRLQSDVWLLQQGRRRRSHCQCLLY